MANTTRQTVWANGDELTATALNAEFDNILTGGVNNIQNANVAANAAISPSKIAGTALVTTDVIDEDSFATDSATRPPSQQSTKAYITATTNTDGWTAANETLTYASATSITVAGVDRTAKYSKGTRLKITQSTGGTKYFIVKSSSFSTDTTINIFEVTDYTLNNEAISSPYYSYQINPQGWPGTFSITPALLEVTLGNGTSTGKINVVGNRLRLQYRYLHGSTSSITGNPNYTLPVNTNPITNTYWKGDVLLEDSGLGLRYDGCDVLSGTTLYVRAANGASGLVASYNNTNPITFATGDNWLASIEYDF